MTARHFIHHLIANKMYATRGILLTTPFITQLVKIHITLQIQCGQFIRRMTPWNQLPCAMSFCWHITSSLRLRYMLLIRGSYSSSQTKTIPPTCRNDIQCVAPTFWGQGTHCILDCVVIGSSNDLSGVCPKSVTWSNPDKFWNTQFNSNSTQNVFMVIVWSDMK